MKCPNVKCPNDQAPMTNEGLLRKLPSLVIGHWSFRHSLRSGLSLLEVILALAILGIALAMIGQCIQLGTRNAMAARDDVDAQLLCESKISELVAGVELPQAAIDEPLDPAGEWLYSVETAAVDDQGLLAVRLTARRANANLEHLNEFVLTRWMIDPEVELAAREADALLAEEINARANAVATGTSNASSSTDTSSTGQGSQTPSTPATPTTPAAPKLPDGLKLPPGFDPSQLPPGFDPSKLPPGFDPSKFDPSKFDPSKFDPSKLNPRPGGVGPRGGGNNGSGRGGPPGGGINGGGRGR